MSNNESSNFMACSLSRLGPYLCHCGCQESFQFFLAQPVVSLDLYGVRIIRFRTQTVF